MQNPALLQAVTLLLAATPISMILIRIFFRIFSKHNPHLAATTTIVSTVIGNLTKGIPSVKSLTFDTHEGILEENSQLIYIENTETKDEIRLEKKQLRQEPTIQFMSATTALCHYPKMHNLETLLGNFFRECGLDSITPQQQYEVISHLPSGNEKKISSTVALRKESGEIFTLSKGNPYKLLDHCNRIQQHDKKNELNHKLRNNIKKKIQQLNKSGEKVIAFAYKPLPFKRLENYSEGFSENEMIWLGMIGIGDYIDRDLTEIIKKLEENNIKCYVVTSARERKALAVVRELDMVNPRYFESVTSKDLEDINDQKLQKMLRNREKDYVFCELTKPDRQRIISTLQDLGETIALANRNHKIKEIYEGITQQYNRGKNQQRIKYHAISCKIAEFIIVGSALILGTPLPLTIPLILMLDLAINLLLELAMRQEKIDLARSDIETTLNGILMGILISFVYFWNLIRFGWNPGEKLDLSPEVHASSITITITLLIFMQILNAYEKPRANPYLIAATIISLLIGCLTYIKLSPLSSSIWPVLIFITLLLLIPKNIHSYLNSKHDA